jgi:hypothetical protein
MILTGHHLGIYFGRGLAYFFDAEIALGFVHCARPEERLPGYRFGVLLAWDWLPRFRYAPRRFWEPGVDSAAWTGRDRFLVAVEWRGRAFAWSQA